MPSAVPTPHRTALTPIAGHFRTGEDYATHRPDGTEDYLLIHTVAGGGVFTDGHGRATLRSAPGETILLRPGTPHHYATPAGGRWELLWTHFVPRDEWRDLLDWPQVWPGLCRLPDAAAARPLLAHLHGVALSADPLRDRLATNALEAVLLACEQANPDRRRHRIDPRLRQVLDHVARHLDRPLTIDALAAVAGLSPSRLSHAFRASLGVTVMQHVETRRIERAGHLLRRTQLGVKQVARQVGFACPFYFSLRFKKMTGKNPTAYRTQ